MKWFFCNFEMVLREALFVNVRAINRIIAAKPHYDHEIVTWFLKTRNSNNIYTMISVCLFRARLRVCAIQNQYFWSSIGHEISLKFHLPGRLTAAPVGNPLKKLGEVADAQLKWVILRWKNSCPIGVCCLVMLLQTASPPRVPCGPGSSFSAS